MNPQKSPLPGDANEEISALIDLLNATEQRLEKLTVGEVDAVADRDGRTFLLRRAQDRLRHHDAATQAAIFNALPAHIALLDTQGIILSVNESWRQFGSANVLQGPGYGIGLNYLEICDSAQGDGSFGAQQVAAGIRAVLDGRANRFSIEYPCHSPTEQRWFLLTVTPLGDDHPHGVIVMHLNVSEKARAKESLRQNEERMRLIADSALDALVAMDATGRIIVWNTQAEKTFGWFREQVIGNSLAATIVPTKYREAHNHAVRGFPESSSGLIANKRIEISALHRDGHEFPVELTVTPISLGGAWIFSSFIRDITKRNEAKDRIVYLNRVYAMLSGINTLIVHGRDRDELFREACRIAVEAGGFRMSWIGIVDRSVMKIAPVASVGADEEFLTAIKDRFTLSEDAALGNTLVARAVREKKAVVSNDSQNDPSVQFNKYHVESGIRSMAILPLIVADEAVGVFALYASEIDFFHEEELKLLTELSGDISFALEHMAGQRKVEKLSRIRAVSSKINAAIIRIRERKALLDETCRIVSEQGKFEMIWIGAIDLDAEQVQPIAWKGFSVETASAVSWASISDSHGSLSEAIQTRKAAVRNDIKGELPGGKLREEALKQGCRSSVCLPLVVDDRVAALVVLFAPGKEFFDQDELALLDEVASDLSFALQAVEQQERLDYLAYYDALTGLANRSLLLERVAQSMSSAVSGGHGLALFLFDLERFKNINDSFGQTAGDALLRQVAEWLTFKAGNANLVARVSADHFAVVLPEVRQDVSVTQLLEKWIEAFLDYPFSINDAVFRIAAKVGAALFPDDGDSADALFKNAEAALKKAKAGGHRYLFYTQKMTAAVADRLALENQLRQALDKGEFVLHYQPKMNLASGKMTSAEALIRWNDPATGLVPPGRFIPILEETGLIYDVGRWALRQAIEDYLRWRNAGLPAVRIAVNVSPLQLRNRGFIAEIEQAIGIDADAAAGLELEITESLIVEDVTRNIAKLQAIQGMGVTIAIDDFGSGFSSLSYLSKLPVDRIKIDRSFVIDMTAEPEGLALVSTIINLAHSLKLKVVAEGVETEEQSRLLRLLDCDEMQGYLISEPVPGASFEARYLAALP